MDSEELIREIVFQSGDGFTGSFSEDRLLPRTTLVDSSGVGKFKVRLYPTEEAARSQEQIVHSVRNEVPMPKLVGRDGCYLVFEYISLGGTSPDDMQYIASGIGSILRNLSEYKLNVDEPIDLDGEFKSWLQTLQRMGYLSKRAIDSIWRRYLAEKPDRPSICLDHWDAMFHNFGLKEKDVYLLDEKHLRYSYACVGLVKPSLLMEQDHFLELLKGYGESDTLHFYQANRPFLLLYYLVVALHFYAQKHLDGCSRIPANSRLRYYRGSLIRMVWRSPVLRVLEAIAFLLRYPGDAFFAFIRRITGPMNPHKLIRRFLLDVQPWDENAF